MKNLKFFRHKRNKRSLKNSAGFQEAIYWQKQQTFLRRIWWILNLSAHLASWRSAARKIETCSKEGRKCWRKSCSPRISQNLMSLWCLPVLQEANPHEVMLNQLQVGKGSNNFKREIFLILLSCFFFHSLCAHSPRPNSTFNVLLPFLGESDCERLKAKPGFNKSVGYFLYLTHPPTWCPTAQPCAPSFSCLWYMLNSSFIAVWPWTQSATEA